MTPSRTRAPGDDSAAAPAGEAEPAAVVAFRKCFLWDATLHHSGRLADYQALFPGFEDAVAREYDRLSSSSQGARPSDGDERAALVGPYRLERILGRGGQGTVYVAKDTRDGRIVALKLLPHDAGNSERRLQRLRREAEAIASLDHPGICRIHEAGLDGDVPYLAMHLVPGRTLGDRIAHARREDPSVLGTVEAGSRLDLQQEIAGAARAGGVARVTYLFERIARAIHAAHEAGLIHRDLKPGNLMVTPEGDPVVLDFGLVRDEEAGGTITVTDAFLGTPAYMAPEQLSTRRVRLDRRVDVYALGVSLFEALTLAHPFEAPTREASLQAVLHEDAKDVRDLDPRFPADLAVIVATAMRRDRDRRYETALALADDLRAFLLARPIRARPLTVGQRIGRWARRHPTLATSSAVAFVALAGGLVVSMRLNEQRRLALEETQSAITRADDVLDFVMTDHRNELTRLGRADVLLPFVERMRQYFDRPESDTASDQDRWRRAKGYHHLGQGYQVAGRLDDAGACFTKAGALLDSLPAGFPDRDRSCWFAAELAKSTGALAGLRGDAATAIRQLALADERIGAIGGPLARGRPVRFVHARALVELAKQLRFAKRPADALVEARRADRIAMDLTEEAPQEFYGRMDAVWSRKEVAVCLDATGDAAGAASALADALDAARRCRHDFPSDSWPLVMLCEVLGLAADREHERGNADKSLENAVACRDARVELARRDPLNISWKRDLAEAHHRVGTALLDSGDSLGACAEHDTAVRILEAILAGSPRDVRTRGYLVDNLGCAGAALGRLNKTSAALERFSKAQPVLDAAIADAPDDAELRFVAVKLLRTRGGVLRAALASEVYWQRVRVVKGERTDQAVDARVQKYADEATASLVDAYGGLKQLIERFPDALDLRREFALVLTERVELCIARDAFDRTTLALLDELDRLAGCFKTEHPTVALPRTLGDRREDQRRYVELLGGLRPPANASEQGAIGVYHAMRDDLARGLPYLRKAVEDTAVRRNPQLWVLWQAARAAAMASGDAPQGERAELRREALAWLAEEVELKRAAIDGLAERIASAPANERAALETRRADQIAHLRRLRETDPAFASLRGSAEFLAIFSAKK